MSLHADALALLRGWPAPDERQERLRQEYVAHLAANPDGLRRDCVPDHITASVLVLSADHTRALLTLHAKAQEWFQLGGHCEPEDGTLGGAALREATEESGIEGLRLDPQPVQLDVHEVPFCQPGNGTRHLDVRFLAVAPPGAGHAVSEESLALHWWPVDALPGADDGLSRLAALAVRRAQSTSSAAI